MVQYSLMIDAKSLAAHTQPCIFWNADNVIVAPHALLRPFIANYTFTNPRNMQVQQTVLPSASSTLVYSVGESGIQSGLRGVNTRPTVIGDYARLFRFLFLVEFHPGGLYPFLRMDQHLLLDDGFSFEDLSRPLHRRILNAYDASEDVGMLAHRLDDIFLKALGDMTMHPALAHGIEAVLRSRGALRIRDLAGELFYSEKQLNRLFRRHIGTGVKTFARIVRMKGAVDLLGGPVSLSRLAEETGHYDPAHFLHDFLDIYGFTPQAYRRRMSLFYNDPFKLVGYHGRNEHIE